MHLSFGDTQVEWCQRILKLIGISYIPSNLPSITGQRINRCHLSRLFVDDANKHMFYATESIETETVSEVTRSGATNLTKSFLFSQHYPCFRSWPECFAGQDALPMKTIGRCITLLYLTIWNRSYSLEYYEVSVASSTNPSFLGPLPQCNTLFR